jgi:hypothetical protein
VEEYKLNIWLTLYLGDFVKSTQNDIVQYKDSRRQIIFGVSISLLLGDRRNI